MPAISGPLGLEAESAVLEGGQVPLSPGRQRLLRAGRVARGFTVPLVLFLIWLTVSSAHLVSPFLLPTPLQVLAAFKLLYSSGLLFDSIAISLQRLVLGYLTGVAIGLPLGIVLAVSPLAHKTIAPTFYFIARIPLVAWIPFLMVIFGIGEALKLAIIAKAALTPVTINTERALASIPKGWVELGRLHRLGKITILRRILLPATLLPVFVGLRFGLIQAWSSLVVVELLASTRGLGYQLTMSRQLFQLDTMLALMVVIGIIGFALDRIVAFAEVQLIRLYGAKA